MRKDLPSKRTRQGKVVFIVIHTNGNGLLRNVKPFILNTELLGSFGERGKVGNRAMGRRRNLVALEHHV